MTRASSEGPVIQLKPPSNIYTLLVIVAIIVLAVTLGYVFHNLLTPVDEGGYGLKLGDLFEPVEKVIDRDKALPPGPAAAGG